MSISQTIVDFADIAIKNGGYMEMDRTYIQNRVLALIGEQALDSCNRSKTKKSAIQLLEPLMQQAQKNKCVGTTSVEQEMLAAQLMDLVTPPPSVVNALFSELYQKEPKQATDYFYKLCKQNDYIKTQAIAKNIVFPVETEYGALEITINLSKPEKDPKQIAQATQAPSISYPKCLLCIENEGYLGRVNHPARTNHRMIRLNLNNEAWFFQYSPYAYYQEHCIILSEEHRPMKIDRQTFDRILQLVDVFPAYFVGSNADLPIVGGSILTHDHYQGGRHDFPMAKAPFDQLFKVASFPKIVAGTVKWPLSVIRLQGANKKELADAAEHILQQWQNYSDVRVSLQAFSEDGTPHHTITPIARKKGSYYELDLVLRDNNVSAEFPDGIFHPHQEVQHIKKENIGLIEVMGLAILPPRLKSELAEVKKYLVDETNLIAEYHRAWANGIKNEYTITKENVAAILKKEIGFVFKRVLEDAGVYKRTAEGQAAFKRFLTTL